MSPAAILAEHPAAVRTAACADLAGRVNSYWDARSDTYSANVRLELGTSVRSSWFEVLSENIPGFGVRSLRVLDLGCGPGMFSILCAKAGCTVVAVDMSTEMLERARENARAEGVPAGRVSFVCGDAANLPFEDGSFDVVMSRNLTWVLPDPLAAYREWNRLLAPGGRTLVFDANWYSYLADEVLNERRLLDQADWDTLGMDDSCRATRTQEDACEELAKEMPMTYTARPAWDMRALSSVGFSSMYADTEVWRRVWTAGEKAYYGSSPMFLVCGVK